MVTSSKVEVWYRESLSFWIKQPERDAEHFPHISVKIKN
jgi:hypothetical protein